MPPPRITGLGGYGTPLRGATPAGLSSRRPSPAERTKHGDLWQKRRWADEKRTKGGDLWQKQRRAGEKRTKHENLCQKQLRTDGKRTKGGDLCQKSRRAGEKRTKDRVPVRKSAQNTGICVKSSGGQAKNAQKAGICGKNSSGQTENAQNTGICVKSSSGQAKSAQNTGICVKSSGGQTESAQKTGICGKNDGGQVKSAQKAGICVKSSGGQAKSAQKTGFLCVRMAGIAWWKRRGRARSNYMPGALPEERPYRTVEGMLAGKVPPLKGDLARFCSAKRCSEPQNAAEKQRRRGGASEAGCCAGWIWLLAALAGWLLEASCSHLKAGRAANGDTPQRSYLIRTMLGTRRWPAWSKRWLSQGLETTPWARVQSVLEPPPSRFRAFSRPSRRAIRAVS